MKRLLLGIAMSMAMVAYAAAADMMLKAPPPVAAYSWSGIYIGGNVGDMWSSYDWAYTNPAPATCCAPFSVSTNEAVIGGHTGGQVQFGHIVVGVEAAISGSLQPNSAGIASQTGCIAGTTTICQIRHTDLGTLGGRLGLAWDNWLLYGTGGGAQSIIRSNLLAPPGNPFDITQATYRGWYAGVGAEMVFMKNPVADAIVGVEYQHVDLGTQLHLAPLDGFSACPPGVNCRNISATQDIVRLRLSLKSNWGWWGGPMHTND